MKFLYYRPEVNGLRGIAVMGAVFYHAEMIFQSFRIFPGGFLGVDVFIVISGYLMTSIILKEYQTTQSFSFRNYYKRSNQNNTYYYWSMRKIFIKNYV